MLLPRMLISLASWGMVLVGNETLITSPPGEERVHELLLGRHHGHPPRVAAELGDRHQVVGIHVIDRLEGQVADQGRLLAGLDVQRLDVLEGSLPVVALAHLARGLLHLVLAPGQLVAGELDQLFGRVRDHLVLELAQEGLAADRVADDLAIPRAAASGRRCAGRVAACAAGRLRRRTAAASLRRHRRRPPPAGAGAVARGRVATAPNRWRRKPA